RVLLRLVGAAPYALVSFRCCVWLVEGSRSIPVVGSEVLEKPYLLHGGDRLVGDGLQQLHVGVRECCDLAVSQANGADDLLLSEHGDDEYAPNATRPLSRLHARARNSPFAVGFPVSR